MFKKALCLCLCLLALIPCALAEEEDTLVIKSFQRIDQVVEQVQNSTAPVIDITATSIAADKVRQLQQTFPDRTFLYRVRAFGHHILWDTDTLDIGYSEYKKITSLTEVMDLLPNLTEVTTYGRVFSDQELCDLKAAYPNVTFHCKFRMAHHTIRTDLTAFCTRHAKYTEKRHTQEDFIAFRHCPDLKALDVGHNAVTDISFLQELPKLQILIMADNQITDLEPIRYQNELVYLELIHNDITDISPLADLTELIDLHIGKCNITDFSPLYGLQKLDRLWLGGNPITEEQLAELQAHLPNTTINATAITYPTAEGWRQGHPRYLKIVEIFGNDKYIPFP